VQPGFGGVDRSRVRRILRDLEAGRLAVPAAMERLRGLGTEDLGFARLDRHRALRTGFPEVVYCPGKTDAQVARILSRLAVGARVVLATRAQESTFAAVRGALGRRAGYNPVARLIMVGRPPTRSGRVVVATGGTSDLPVAEEAAATAAAMGARVVRLFDVGVAGVHRLLENRRRLVGANAIVVVAGMEGALPSVVAGLVECPVIAVPTSVGYGASFGGMAALLAMLNACAPGVAVVNIDNGFGAGYLAARINARSGPQRKKKPKTRSITVGTKTAR